MEKTIQLHASKQVSLCSYGPGMTTKEVVAIANTAHEGQATTLFLQELDAQRLYKKEHTMASVGLIASLPFAGVALEDTLGLLAQAQALGCKAFAFGLPMGMIKDNCFDELDSMLQKLQQKAGEVELYPTLGISHISEEQALKAVRLCLERGAKTVCLGSGTPLDSVEEKHLEALLAKGVDLASLEIGISMQTLLAPTAEEKWLLKSTIALRICSSTRTREEFPLQFTTLTRKEPSHDE